MIHSVAKMMCPMKQFFSYLGASLAAIAALASCNKELEAPVEDLKGGVPFEICASTADTKTAIDDLATSWVAGDAINLFHAEAGKTTYKSDAQFKITADNLNANKFTGTLSEKLTADSYDWYAIYPYKEEISSPADQTDGYVYIGHSKGAIQDGYNSTAHLCETLCPLYGVSKSVEATMPVSIKMKHLASVVEINVTNSNDEPLTVSSISFSTDEDIVGSYYINFAGQTVVYNPSDENYVKTVANLTVQNGTALAKGKTASFYIPIKPHVAEQGKVITITVNGYEKTISLTKDVTFTAGKIKKIAFKYDYVAPSPQPYSLWKESIADGDYIIVGEGNSEYSALNTTISSKRAGLTGVDIVDNTITTNDAAIIWHIEKSGDYYTIYNAREAKYLAATGTKNQAQLLADGTDDKSLWTITSPAEGNTFTIVNKSNAANNINATLRRNGTNGFATYAASTGTAPALYKLDNRELKSIAITTPATKTTFNVDDSFNSDGLVVTATFNDASTSVIVPVVETPDMSSVGTKTVNVSYTFKKVTKSTSYDIVVKTRPAFSVTLSDDESQLTEEEAGRGVVLPSRTSAVEGYTFIGWSETECDVKTTTSPTIIPSGTYYPSKNVTLYPIYKQTVSSVGWELVTDLSTVTEGVYALVTSTYKAFNGSINSSGNGSTTTKGFNFTSGFAESAPEGTCELTLTVSGSGFKMYNAENGYLYAKAKTSGNLAWQKSETSYWYYAGSNWVYKAQSANLRSYNETFRTYGANNGQALWMAKKTTKDVGYYVSTPVAE